MGKSSAGVPPAIANAPQLDFAGVKIRTRGRLPHWEREGAVYFIAFRLKDSLPEAVLERIRSERESIVKTAAQLNRKLSSDEEKTIRKLSTRTIEEYLDTGRGACHLKDPRIAQGVGDTLRHFDHQRYRLFAWCVMPNHVHVVALFLPGHTLASVLHSWKSFSAKHANRILESHGAFWQREYYDHLIRDEAELEHAIQYVADNPVKASLQNWQWVWISEALAGEDAGATAPRL